MTAGGGEREQVRPQPRMLRVLRVDTTLAPAAAGAPDRLDYGSYRGTPPWRRRVETLLRLDFGLARRAMERAPEFDVLLCGSEKVAIPLALLGCRTPIVAVVHNVASPLKAAFVRALGVARRWAKVGVITRADAEFMTRVFGVSPRDIFCCASAPVGRLRPGPPVRDGILVATGVARRDYATLTAALARLPGCRTEIFAGSRFGDRDRTRSKRSLEWLRWMPAMEYAEVVGAIRDRARFVVVPLADSTQYGAGCSAILEAFALGKAVIATRTNGTVDWVHDGVTGLLVPPGDADALRGAIRRLWDDPDLAASLGREGRRLAEEQFGPRATGARLQQAVMAAALEGRAASGGRGPRPRP